MKEKGIGWGGAILIFIVGSLVLTLAINPQFRRDIGGFFDSLTGTNALSPSEVNHHPNEYLGENITVKGYWIGGGICGKRLSEIQEGELDVMLSCEIENNATDNVALTQQGEYYFTGVLEVRDIWKSSQKTVVLHVKDIEPT